MYTPKLIPLSKASQKFGLQADTIRKKIVAGEITGAEKINGRWYFSEGNLNKAIQKFRGAGHERS